MHFAIPRFTPPNGCPLPRLRLLLAARRAGIRDVAAVWNCALLSRCPSRETCRAAVPDLIDAVAEPVERPGRHR